MNYYQDYYLDKWYEELRQRWSSGEKLSDEDVHRMNYLRDYLFETYRAANRPAVPWRVTEADEYGMGRYFDVRIVVE